MSKDSRRTFISKITGGTLLGASLVGCATNPGSPHTAQAQSALTTPMIYNVKDYGALGDGIHDDTANIQAAIDAATAAGGGDVHLPNGTYVVSNAGITGAGCLWLKTGVRLVGESKTGTIIKLASTQVAMTRPVLAKDCADAAVLNLTIDGNKANQDTEEHRAAIFLWNASRTYLADLILRDNTGDGLDLYVANDTTMERCYAHDNLRKAVSINGGGGSRGMTFRDCDFIDNVGQLHVEAQGTVYDLHMDNVFCGEPTGGGWPVSIGGPIEGATIDDCTIIGGLNIVYAKRVRVNGGYVSAGAQTNGPAPLSVQFSADDVILTDVVLDQIAAQGGQDNVVRIQAAAAMGQDRPNCKLVRCTIKTAYALAAGVAIINAGDVTLDDCTFIGCSPAAGRLAVGVNATDPGLPGVGRVVMRNCKVSGFTYPFGVYGYGPGTIASVELRGNTASTPNGFYLSDAGAIGQLAMTGNESTNGVPTVLSWPDCPVLVGGSRGSGGQYSVVGAPTLAEVTGATAVRRDGGAGSTFYVKEPSGWVAK